MQTKGGGRGGDPDHPTARLVSRSTRASPKFPLLHAPAFSPHARRAHATAKEEGSRMIGSLSRGAAGAERRGGSRGWPVPSRGDPIVEISRRGLGPCARGAAGAERGGELRGWPVQSPGRSNRGNLTVVGGDRAEEETDEEDENRRSMVAAHHRPQSGLCYQVAQLVLVKMYQIYSRTNQN